MVKDFLKGNMKRFYITSDYLKKEFGKDKVISNDLPVCILNDKTMIAKIYK